MTKAYKMAHILKILLLPVFKWTDLPYGTAVFEILESSFLILQKFLKQLQCLHGNQYVSRRAIK